MMKIRGFNVYLIRKDGAKFIKLKTGEEVYLPLPALIWEWDEGPTPNHRFTMVHAGSIIKKTATGDIYSCSRGVVFPFGKTRKLTVRDVHKLGIYPK
jgi:hypothetical protein